MTAMGDERPRQAGEAEERAPGLTYGVQPGLRFACILDGQGGCRILDWDALSRWTPDQGVAWVHLERDDPHAADWLRRHSGIDPVHCDALLAAESRPRVEDSGDALLIVLRGVNRSPGSDAIDLVPIHLWVDGQRVISLREKHHYLLALRDIRESLKQGHGPRSAGELFVQIAEKIVQDIQPAVAELEDEADELDDRLLEHDSLTCRKKLSDMRRHAIQLRRYMAPQREALFRLQVQEASWLSTRGKVRLREVTDGVLRHVENLDAVRDRATILHEDLAAQIAENHAKASNRLTLIAAVLLPPSLFAGLLGANVGGVPGSDSPWAFAIVVVMALALFPLEIWVLRRLNWL
jgi:zinc transporter